MSDQTEQKTKDTELHNLILTILQLNSYVSSIKLSMETYVTEKIYKRPNSDNLGKALMLQEGGFATKG